MSNSHIISFMLHAAIAPDCAAAFSNASKSMAALGERAAALSRTAGDTGRYQALQASIAQNKTALAAMDAQAWKLRGSLKRLPQGKTTEDLAALEAKCAKLRGTIETDSAALGKLKTALSRLGDEHARLEAQVGKVHGAMERLAGAQGRLADTKARLRLGGLRSEIMSSGATLMALKAPVAVAASFEQAMARVEAVSFGGRAKGEQEAALAAMREQALELGSTTRFTATEAANAQEALARAGMKTGEIVAAMPSVLDMAAAEGMGLGEAASIVSKTLRGFGLEADQAARVADVLAKASASSNTNIAELGEALRYVAPIAASLGVDLEETTALLGTMANAGIKASQGRTALKGAFTRLAREPAMAEKALRSLGVASRDAPLLELDIGEAPPSEHVLLRG